MKDRIAFARALRREQTPAERAFWALLHPWRERGMHWRRQAPIGPYVVDFCCKSRKLLVEIDGDSHFSDAGISHDAVRTAYLRQRAFNSRVAALSLLRSELFLGNPHQTARSHTNELNCEVLELRLEDPLATQLHRLRFAIGVGP